MVAYKSQRATPQADGRATATAHPRRSKGPVDRRTTPRVMKQSLRRALAPLVLFLVSSVALPGCAYIRAESARSSSYEQALDTYVIKKPLKEVWESVSTADGPWSHLFFNGLAFTWKDVGEYHAVTDKRSDRLKTGWGLEIENVWYEAEGEDLGDGCRVRYYKVTETTTISQGKRSSPSTRRDRDLEMEIELVKYFDPAAAAKIEADGEKAAQAAN